MRFFTVAKTLARYWRMAQDPRTPPIVRYLIYGGLIYTLSPIDLLPDWFPILGLLDDAAVLPAVIALAMQMIPREVKESHDVKEHKELAEKKFSGQIKALDAQQKKEEHDIEKSYMA
jgi:uncharacterized membrane protein YkvA (DUF1232 family)